MKVETKREMNRKDGNEEKKLLMYKGFPFCRDLPVPHSQNAEVTKILGSWIIVDYI